MAQVVFERGHHTQCLTCLRVVRRKGAGIRQQSGPNAGRGIGLPGELNGRQIDHAVKVKQVFRCYSEDLTLSRRVVADDHIPGCGDVRGVCVKSNKVRKQVQIVTVRELQELDITQRVRAFIARGGENPSDRTADKRSQILNRPSASRGVRVNRAIWVR